MFFLNLIMLCWRVGGLWLTFFGPSFFGDQEGPFELGIISIAAVRTERYLDDPEGEDLNGYMDEKSGAERQTQKRRGWFGGLFRCFGL
jgi:hypothetical protein